MTTASPAEILTFWFDKVGADGWFGGGADLDAKIAERFGDLHAALSDHVPDDWLATPAGLLAAIIVLDQFSRNIHRGTAAAFASDADAVHLTRLAMERGWDGAYPPDCRQFVYMPFMHGESMAHQDEAVRLFAAQGLEESLDFAKRHRDVIARFGRFPHRNAALGRTTTAEEQAYLDEGGGF
ncbi:MAG: DUF924 family protein [Pseudomonadota bacterium]